MSGPEVNIDETFLQSLPQLPEIQAEMRRRAELVAARAREICPVDTGAARDSISVDSRDDGGYDVVGGVSYFIYIEFGTRQTDRNGRRIHPARFVLGNALDAATGD